MPINLPRKFIDLVHQVSGEWINWNTPTVPVHLGDFGTLDENGEFIASGNIYSDEFQQYLKGIESSFDLNACPVTFAEFDRNYVVSSPGVKKEQLDVDKFVNIPNISTASFKETWKFQDGKRGVLLILISSYTISISDVILAETLRLKIERLEGKHLVTAVHACPAYLKLLSNKSEETVSVAFLPPASGVDVVNTEGTGWWTDAQSELLRRDTHPHGKPIFTPLFSLKHCKLSQWGDVYPPWGSLDEDGKESTSKMKLPVPAVDVYPPRSLLDKDGEELTTKMKLPSPAVGMSTMGSHESREIRTFIDLVHNVSGKWTNWDPSIPVTVGAYGTLDQNGEFNIDGNIYSEDFQKYLEDQGLNFVMKDYRPELAEQEQDYIVASDGVTESQFNYVDQLVNAPVASASIKGTWKFQGGKHGALIILLSPRTSFVPSEIMAKVLNTELLRGKYIVTNALSCPAYLMCLSNKSGESLSVAFCARTQGDVVNARVGGEWWTHGEAGLLRRGSNPNGEYLFIPLFTLKQALKRSWLPWKGDGEQPTGEGYSKFFNLVHNVSGKWTNWDPSIPVTVGAYGTLDQNGEFNIDGNIYSEDFQKYLEDQGLNFVMKDYRPELAEQEQDYIVASDGVQTEGWSHHLYEINASTVSASIKRTWKFQGGKCSALIILLSPRTIFIPDEIITKILNVELLRGKHIVTNALSCPAYLMCLSNKSGESLSVAFCARTCGDVVNAGVGGEWWTDGGSALLRRGSDPNRNCLFTPLFTLRQSLKRSRFTWRGDEEQLPGEEYSPAGSPVHRKIRKFMDLVRKVSGKWTNLDPPIPVTVGAYGTLNQNGEFNMDGNVYSDEFQKYLDDQGFNFVARDYRPKLAEQEQDYIVASDGVTESQFNYVDQLVNAPVASASIKGTWKFQGGKHGALIILLSPRTSFVPSEIMAKVLNTELLRGKYLVTNALSCPAYLMCLSNKSGESLSVAFCARKQGDVVNARAGGKWWTDGGSALLRNGSHPNGEYVFTPLFSLKEIVKRPRIAWRGEEDEHIGGEYSWKDVYPDWKPLDNDGEELDD